MANVTVSQLAETIGTPVDRLLQQMQEAGLPKSKADEVVSEEEKLALLAHIKMTHGDTEEKAPKKITLKRRTISTLKKAGGTGRGRTVNVEVRKKRTYVRKDDEESEAGEPKIENAGEVEEASVVAASSPVESPAESVIVEVPAEPVFDEEAHRNAVMAEIEAEANKRHSDAAKKVEAAALEAQVEIDAAAAIVKKKSDEEAAKKAKDALESKVSTRKDKRDRHDLDDKDSKEKRAKHGAKKRPNDRSGGRGGRLGLSKARSRRSARSHGSSEHQFNAPTETQVRQVEVGESITVSQLSQKMSVKGTDVIRSLMGLGVMANINQTVDQDTAILIVEEFGHTVKLMDAHAIENSIVSEEMALAGEKLNRAPVVTVMGHVDHGKTSLLDYIRSASVVTGEAGGITQHIGAYRVPTDHGDICFIDTPGHAAFTAMRQRGANATDIVILVVAADDGVMPQTEEAIKHAKAAGAPIVVAVNKMDKEGADLERVKSELAARDVIPDGWGGDTQFVPVSAITGDGINDLLEAVLLQAELLELSAVQEGAAHGIVIESELEKGRGPVATLLIQNGTLAQGDVIVAGDQFGRVRSVRGDQGDEVKSAGPSTPVSVLGLSGTPAAGDSFVVVKDEKRAREIAQFRKDRLDEVRLATPAASLDNLLASFGSSEIDFLNIVVKADVRGSLEAIVTELQALGNDEVKVNVVYSGVGGIAEHDVNFALTSGAVVFGFNVRADTSARRIVEAEGLDLRYYKVIYDLVDDVRDALSGMLSPEIREEIMGIALVKDVFQSKKLGSIAGCMITEGTVHRDKKIRVLRDDVVIYEGELESLRHFKEEVSSARNGTECGIGVKNYNDVKVGDQIEVFDTREVARAL
ncbi:MAG: translation initiation factor IF-2 [Candidatus Azotimanducaceae bacterium]|jgi:translation initiation factor IF-2